MKRTLLRLLLLLTVGICTPPPLYAQDLIDGALAAMGGADALAQVKTPAAIACHCFGKVTADCISIGAIGGNYDWPCQTAAHRTNCCERVKAFVAALTSAQREAILQCLCAKGITNGTPINVTSAVGTGEYQSCGDPIGTFYQQPAYDVTTCKCPPGWLANTTNVDGGVTSDGKCKKGVCGWDATAFPPPSADATPVGTWGFTWGNGLYAWGTADNHGKASCATVHHDKGPCHW